jgi:hypothetical protein
MFGQAWRTVLNTGILIRVAIVPIMIVSDDCHQPQR